MKNKLCQIAAESMLRCLGANCKEEEGLRGPAKEV